MDPPPTRTPIARQGVVDALVARLRADVLAERYPPGSYLPPERDLAAGYGVTRTSLKHALVRLVEAGLLETRHGIGTRVRDFRRDGGAGLLPYLVAAGLRHRGDAGWLAEVLQARREIGALVAARAARHATGEQRARLRALVAEVRAAGSAEAARRAEWAAHRILAAACANRVYALLVNSLLRAYEEVPHLFAAPFADPVAVADRLARLVEAVCAGDGVAASRAAETYYAETERLMPA
ncbi:FadR/GntR family transcriptional regulator [Planosporangium sp. 12N6]|uniref:FadR/GntR family transcriptional regulator n=1 Tax=Planosporangium spinosum TaxID=3402278 RepID=UPI003CFB0C98